MNSLWRIFNLENANGHLTSLPRLFFFLSIFIFSGKTVFLVEPPRSSRPPPVLPSSLSSAVSSSASITAHITNTHSSALAHSKHRQHSRHHFHGHSPAKPFSFNNYIINLCLQKPSVRIRRFLFMQTFSARMPLMKHLPMWSSE